MKYKKDIEKNIGTILAAQKDLQKLLEKEGNGRFVHIGKNISSRILNAVKNIAVWIELEETNESK
jgi:hypothetical protein